MSTAKRLAFIALGYVLAVAGGLAAVAVNELRMPADIAQGSPGMVAFGDMILLVPATGFFSLAPTWFLLRLLVEKAPRALLCAELLLAALGPLSWLALVFMARGYTANGAGVVEQHAAIGQLLGFFIAFIAIPRVVAGPVMVVIEGLTFLMVRARAARVLLVAAMLMDIVPIAIYVLHFVRRP